MSHPNSTDELLNDKIPTPPPHYVTRSRREIDDWESDDWDNIWENPVPTTRFPSKFRSRTTRVRL